MKPTIYPSPGILFLPTSTGIELIQISSLIRVEAISNYSKLFFNSPGGIVKTLVVAKVLKWFEQVLADKGFARIHRSHLINVSHIEGFNNHHHLKVVLQNHEQIDISRRKRSSVLKRLAQSMAA